MNIGDRITINYATVFNVNDYIGKDYMTGKTQQFFRVSLNGQDGERYYFTSPICDVKKGDIISLRGTIKKFNNQFNTIRLVRIKITERHSTMHKGLLL